MLYYHMTKSVVTKVAENFVQNNLSEAAEIDPKLLQLHLPQGLLVNSCIYIL